MGIPQEVISLLSSDQGMYLEGVSVLNVKGMTCLDGQSEKVEKEQYYRNTYEKTTSWGKLSPALRDMIAIE